MHVVVSGYKLDLDKQHINTPSNASHRKLAIFKSLYQEENIKTLIINQPVQRIGPYCREIHSVEYCNFLEQSWNIWKQLFSNPNNSDSRDQVKYIQDSIKFYARDSQSAIQSDTSNILLHDVAVVLHASKMISDKTIPYAYALTSLPGHRASQTQYGDNSMINYSALAAKVLLDSTCGDDARITILDLGLRDGLYDMFEKHENISTISIYQEDIEETKTKTKVKPNDNNKKKDFIGTIKFPLPVLSTWIEYEPMLRQAVQLINQQTRTEFVVVAFGADTLYDIDNKKTGFQLFPKDFIKMGEIIKELKYRILFVQEDQPCSCCVGTVVKNFFSSFQF